MKIGERVGLAGMSLRKVRTKENPKYSSHKTIIILSYRSKGIDTSWVNFHRRKALLSLRRNSVLSIGPGDK